MLSFRVSKPTKAARRINTLRAKNTVSRSLALTVDKAEYLPGDTAQILVKVILIRICKFLCERCRLHHVKEYGAFRLIIIQRLEDSKPKKVKRPILLHYLLLLNMLLLCYLK